MVVHGWITGVHDYGCFVRLLLGPRGPRAEVRRGKPCASCTRHTLCCALCALHGLCSWCAVPCMSCVPCVTWMLGVPCVCCCRSQLGLDPSGVRRGTPSRVGQVVKCRVLARGRTQSKNQLNLSFVLTPGGATGDE